MASSTTTTTTTTTLFLSDVIFGCQEMIADQLFLVTSPGLTDKMQLGGQRIERVAEICQGGK
jgi:hypothetical protein